MGGFFSIYAIVSYSFIIGFNIKLSHPYEYFIFNLCYFIANDAI